MRILSGGYQIKDCSWGVGRPPGSRLDEGGYVAELQISTSRKSLAGAGGTRGVARGVLAAVVLFGGRSGWAQGAPFSVCKQGARTEDFLRCPVRGPSLLGR